MMLHAGFMRGMGRGQGSLFVMIFKKYIANRRAFC